MNYPSAQWPRVIAVMTITFGLGQTLGPFVTGAITDYTGSLTSALNVSTAALALGADGKALGMQLLRKVPGAGKDRPQVLLVILPAKEIAAIAKQVESGAVPAEKPAEPAAKPPAPAPKAPAK